MGDQNIYMICFSSLGESNKKKSILLIQGWIIDSPTEMWAGENFFMIFFFRFFICNNLQGIRTQVMEWWCIPEMWELPDLKGRLGRVVVGTGQKAFVIVSGRIGGAAAGSRNCDFHCYKNLNLLSC